MFNYIIKLFATKVASVVDTRLNSQAHVHTHCKSVEPCFCLTKTHSQFIYVSVNKDLMQLESVQKG